MFVNLMLSILAALVLAYAATVITLDRRFDEIEERLGCKAPTYLTACITVSPTPPAAVTNCEHLPFCYRLSVYTVYA